MFDLEGNKNSDKNEILKNTKEWVLNQGVVGRYAYVYIMLMLI